MITVPAGSTLVLRCTGDREIALISVAEVSAPFVSDLPEIPVLNLDGSSTRRFGILELVSSAGVTWIEAELNDSKLIIIGGLRTDLVQRRAAPRKPGQYAAAGTAQVDERLVPITGVVEDISTTGLLLKATAEDGPHLPPGIERTLLHVTMPWGDMTVAVTTVDQISDQLRGTYEWIDAADSDALKAFCAAN